jgi:hypothetical protein
MTDYVSITPDVKLGENVKLSKFINLYGCEIGDNTKIGAFVEIQKNAKVGKNCKVSSHTFICEGVTVENNVFIGHSVTFINDSYPRAATSDSRKGGNRRELHCGCRQRCYKRRACQYHRCRESCEGSALHRISIQGERMTNNCKVPFVDLVTLHRELEVELLEVCKRVIETAGFVGGPEVEGFEREFADYCGVQHCVGVNSGTDALLFALVAAGIRPGDIVLTVSHTFIATTEAISQAREDISTRYWRGR